jgi:DNA topoisomerase I
MDAQVEVQLVPYMLRAFAASEFQPPKARPAPVPPTKATVRYVDAAERGWSRKRASTSFIYVDPMGKRVRDARALARIASLAIPPAWENVWICSTDDGHIQAHGRDARGRKQYRYHPEWRRARDEVKYEDLAPFALSLPRLRESLERDLALPGLPKRKVIAAIVRLLEETRIRVGGDQYARENDSYGLTTMRDRHAKFAADKLEFRFRGKSGVSHSISVRDRRLAKIVKQCQDIPGQRLFQYEDEKGRYRPVTSTDVNAYLARNMKAPFTAKMFRTWAATVGAAMLLACAEPATSTAHGRRVVKAATENVAQYLGNTATICKNSYIHPIVVDAYFAGVLQDQMRVCLALASKSRPRYLEVSECAVVRLFERLGQQREILVAA